MAREGKPTGRTFCKCTRCEHGKKPLSSKTCTPCVLKKKDNFKDRGKEWPVVPAPHIGEVGPLTRIHLYREPPEKVRADYDERRAA